MPVKHRDIDMRVFNISNKALLIFSCIGLLLSMAFFHVSMAQQKEIEHPANNERVVLDPKLFWFYEAMDKLENVRIAGKKVYGTFSERLRKTDFSLDKKKWADPIARTEGYKLAIEKIVYYMAPGVVPDNESNRKYMKELLAKLKAITGMNFTSYEEWKSWFDTNRNRLQWSTDKNMLVVLNRNQN